MLQKKEKNNLRPLLILLSAGLFLFTASAVGQAFWGIAEKVETRGSESGSYRVYYAQTGDLEEKPEVGFGKFRRLDYKVVYEGDWKANASRVFKVSFLDAEGYEVLGETRPDSDLSPRGEYYGSLWIKDGQWKKIKSVRVKELFPWRKKRKKKNKNLAAQSESEEVSNQEEPPKDNKPKGLFNFGKTVYTDEMIRKELEKRKVALQPADGEAGTEPEEKPDEEEVQAEVTDTEIEEA